MNDSEEDFEKEKYSNLIKKIKSIKDEELSEEFDKKFYSGLGDIPPKPLLIRLKLYFSAKFDYWKQLSFFGTPRLVYAMSLTVIALILVVVLFVLPTGNITNLPQLTYKNLGPGKDSSLAANEKTNEVAKVIPPTKVNDKLNKQNYANADKYFNGLWKDAFPGLAFGSNKNIKELKKVLTGKDFGKYLDSLRKINPISRNDTINYIIGHF